MLLRNILAGLMVIVAGWESDALTCYRVVWSLADENVRRCEVDRMADVAEMTGCRTVYLITADTQEEITLDDGLVIHVVSVWHWLLGL